MVIAQHPKNNLSTSVDYLNRHLYNRIEELAKFHSQQFFPALPAAYHKCKPCLQGPSQGAHNHIGPVRFQISYWHSHCVKTILQLLDQIFLIAAIIAKIYNFSRRPEGVPSETIEINSVIEGAFKFLGQQMRNHNIEVVEDLGTELPKVVGDPIRLEQVFLNLISNARNAIETAGKEKKRIEIKTYATNSSVVIGVKDNGGGIPEHIQEKIFQPFFTTKAPGEGTGLGLSVSSKIIEEHQGRMELDSTVGEGTSFRMILPAAE